MDAQIYEMKYKEMKCNKNSYKNSRDIFYTKCLFLFDCNMPFQRENILLVLLKLMMMIIRYFSLMSAT